ncbi:MAG: ABC transporter ATP-binding protein [Caldilineaceae bacterium]
MTTNRGTLQGLKPKQVNKHHTFWRLMGATPGISLAVVLLNTLHNTLPLLFGLILRAFFDALSGQKSVGWSVWTLVAFFLATRVAVQLAEMGAAGSSAYQYFLVETLLRRNLFRGILQAAGFQPPLSSGEIVNRYEEDTAAVSEPVFIATYGISLFVAAGLALWVMLRINLMLTLIAFAPAVIALVLMQLLGKRIEVAHEAARNSNEQVSGLLTQLLHGVQALQVAGAEEAAVQRFAQLSDQRQKAGVHNEVLNTVIRSMNATSIGIATGLLLLFAAGLMRQGSFTVGDLALFISYSGGGTLDELVYWVGRLLRAYQRSQVSWDRLFALLPSSSWQQLTDRQPPHLHGSLPTVQPLPKSESDSLHELAIRSLTYHHPDSGRGIEQIDLTLRKGDFVVITGRIGSGKSLLVQTLLGLLPRTAGTILWNGQPVKEPARFFTPPRCAYTPQIPRLFSDSVRENILMGLPEASVDLSTALDLAVLSDDIAQLEAGLETVVGPRGIKLSGGQIQRTAAARMFVRSGKAGAELLIFDDLSSALDVETERQLWQRLFAQPDRPACLVISHRRAALQQADRIVVLKQGRVEDQGTLEELLGRCGEMQHLWEGEVE